MEILATIVAQAQEKAESGAYRSYLKTKEFGYRKIAQNFSGGNVLELGSDESPTSSVLVRWSERLTIVDMVDKSSLKLLQDTALSSVNFVLSRWEDFSTDEKFSDIVLTDSLEHVDDPVQTLSLCGKWLAQGGHLHIIVPNALSLHRLIGVEMGFLETPYHFNQNDVGSGHRRVYDTTLIRHDISAARLAISRMEPIQCKPFTDTQSQQFSIPYIEALDKIARFFPDNGAEIYVCCTL
ncbi:MAG: methyltransferase domain-containing protein [Candidatus Ozemobacteraceae bacterium]